MKDKQRSLFELTDHTLIHKAGHENIGETAEKIITKKESPVKSQVTWQLYVDGASRGNPGHAGAGVYVTKNSETVVHQGFYLGKKTNNEAEYCALLIGLFLVKKEMQAHENLEKLQVFSDSQLLVYQINGVYQVKKPELRMLYTSAKHELATYELAGVTVVFQHILREYNSKADEAANSGIDTRNPLPDKFLHMMRSHNVVR